MGKKYAVISMILLIFGFFALAANAAEPKAYYLVEGKYDARNETYTVDVYLDTNVYLAAGTFGMEFDENIDVKWSDGTKDGENAGYMQINTDNFEYLETKVFEENRNEFKSNRQIAVQWGMNDIYDPAKGKIKLGSFKIEDVKLTDGKIEGWSDTPFRLLDWTTTKLAKDSLFTQKDMEDGYGKSLNDEIWRITTEEERKNGAPAGYYQGYVYDNDEWIDIGFKFTMSPDKEILITGTVNAYNPNNDIQVAAYTDGGAQFFAGKIKERIIHPDGGVTYKYEIPVKETGGCTLKIQKNIHLTYIEHITIPEATTDEYNTEKEITLLCGDINSDGCIKLPDRAYLIRFLNGQIQAENHPEDFEAADLNGDGRINLSDLNILKSNLDKTY